jgi:hypothetical protein
MEVKITLAEILLDKQKITLRDLYMRLVLMEGQGKISLGLH